MSVRLPRAVPALSIALALGGLVTLAACDKDKKEGPAAAESAPAPSASVATANTPPAGEAQGETEEDFEEEAMHSVTNENLEAEIAKLEAEIR